MDRLRRLSWYERVKSDPSPQDGALLQVTREVSEQFDSRFWYRQIVWGRFHRGGVGWMISKPVISRELWLGPLGVPQVELMLPDYLKAKLSLDEWRVLITMHLVRVKAYGSGRMSRLMGTMALGIFSVFVPLLIFLPALVGTAWTSILIFPGWAPGFLVSVLWVRRRLRKWEFELDRDLANRFGTEQVLQVLEKIDGLEPRVRPPSKGLVYRFTHYWSPSTSERIEKLKHPESVSLPKPSRMPAIGLRGRVVIALVGIAVYLTPGFVAARLFFSQGQTIISCATQTCIALIMISFVGFVLIIVGGISTTLAVVRRVRQKRWKKKHLV